MPKKMPSQEERLKRISKNYNAMSPSARKNIKRAGRSSEIVKHAQGTASGASRPESAPQRRYKRK